MSRSASGWCRTAPVKTIAVRLLFLFFWGSSAWAQTTFGAITGTVTDASGAMIAEANVSVTNERTGMQRWVMTGKTGVYAVANLDLGVYTVSLRKEGFQGYKKTGVHLDANQVINIDAQLRPGSISTTVEVVAPSGAELNTQTPTLSNVIPATQMEQLPIITRQKGDQGLWGYASYNNGIGHEPFFIANGSRYVDTQPTVDGITAMSYETGIGGSTVMTGMEATAELSVELATAPAEFSRPVQMTMVSKSGANEFHGSIFEDYNGNSLNARDFFSESVPFRVYNNFGASLGGRPYPQEQDVLFWRL